MLSSLYRYGDRPREVRPQLRPSFPRTGGGPRVAMGMPPGLTWPGTVMGAVGEHWGSGSGSFVFELQATHVRRGVWRALQSPRHQPQAVDSIPCWVRKPTSGYIPSPKGAPLRGLMSATVWPLCRAPWPSQPSPTDPPCPSSPQGTSDGLGSIDDIETGNVADGMGGEGAQGRLSPLPKEKHWVQEKRPHPEGQTLCSLRGWGGHPAGSQVNNWSPPLPSPAFPFSSPLASRKRHIFKVSLREGITYLRGWIFRH